MLHKSSHNLSISQYLIKNYIYNQNLNYCDTYIGLQFKIWKSNFILSRFVVLHFSTGNKQIVCSDSDSLCWVDFVILTNGGKLMQKQPTCYCFLNVTGVIYHKAQPKWLRIVTQR